MWEVWITFAFGEFLLLIAVAFELFFQLQQDYSVSKWQP